MKDHLELKTRRFKRVEYDKLTEMAIWAPDERLELLDGLLVVREPQGTSHATAIRLAVAALRNAFSAEWHIDSQLPVALDDDSEPEPDVAVVPGGERDYRVEHPRRPALIVEVADSSLMLDRRFKMHLYARAGVLEFWIVNLVQGVVEVYREPVASETAEYGATYASVVIARTPDTITPLAAPQSSVSVDALLP